MMRTQRLGTERLQTRSGSGSPTLSKWCSRTKQGRITLWLRTGKQRRPFRLARGCHNALSVSHHVAPACITSNMVKSKIAGSDPILFPATVGRTAARGSGPRAGPRTAVRAQAVRADGTTSPSLLAPWDQPRKGTESLCTCLWLVWRLLLPRAWRRLGVPAIFVTDMSDAEVRAYKLTIVHSTLRL